MMTKKEHVSIDFGRHTSDALSDESDRACVILVASWVYHFLRIKLAHEFDKGNADARSELFSSNGPFATFSAKLNVAFCAGWIDRDVYDDLQVIRRMRNKFAHSVDRHTLHNEPFPVMVAKLRVPKRQYYDWRQLRAGATDSGVMVFTGEPPVEADEDFYVSESTFRMGNAVLVAVLDANLGIPHETGASAGTVVLEFAEHMREIPE